MLRRMQAFREIEVSQDFIGNGLFEESQEAIYYKMSDLEWI